MVRQAVLLLVVVVASTQATSPTCDKELCALHNHLHHYYEELGCKPVTPEGRCCPASFDCSHLATRDPSKCYFKGRTLDMRPDLAEIEPSICLAACFCKQTREAGAVASLTCAHIECPEMFNPSIIPPGCVATYSTERCCSDGVLCPQNVTATTAKCEWGGKTYLEGQKFYPDEEPCKVCTCRQGFDGTLNGAWCRKVTCGLEPHHAKDLAKGCAPVFLDGNSCCPIEWRCPAEGDNVVPAVTTKTPEEIAADATCKWGSLTLRRGDSLTASTEGMEKQCLCDTPPHVTCTARPSRPGPAR